MPQLESDDFQSTVLPGRPMMMIQWKNNFLSHSFVNRPLMASEGKGGAGDLSRENLYLRKLRIFIAYLLRLLEGWTAVEGWTPCDELAPAVEVPGPAWPILPCPAWAPGCVGPAGQTGIQVGRPKGDGGLFETKWGGWGRGCPLISGVSTGPIKFLQFLNLSPFFSIGLSIKAQRGRTSGLPL